MKIILDGFGGDNAPLEILKGAADAVAELGVEIRMTGDEQTLRKVAEENGISLTGIEFVQASDVITMEDEPTSILKEKADCSMAVGLRLLRDGGGDAFVSAGNTGALVVGGTMIVRRIKGVKRPALAPVLPSAKGCFMLLDVGANVECRPEMLVQFGLMGSLYMKAVMDVEDPVVGLVNIGTEECKGTALQTESYQLMKKSGYHFGGNVEAREIPVGEYDVVVADGFTGNVILKLFEGLSKEIMGQIKGVFMQNLKTKIAAKMVYSNLRSFKKRMDYTEYGGSPLLGTAKPVFKAHGSSNAKAIKNAIRQAKVFCEKDVIGKIEAGLAATKAESKPAE
ncbi:MAG: phosphate acyltransferase PlsX [Ruminococcaceae bacterium]|nr:phosphate acyltransferase PlsX [Oscillospiraceae bacterium]